jgi:hypothetical protein
LADYFFTRASRGLESTVIEWVVREFALLRL